jgi:hypothetical protein
MPHGGAVYADYSLKAKLTTGTTSTSQRAAFEFELAGRQTQQIDYDANGYTPVFQKNSYYNAKGQITSDTSTTKQGNDTLVANTTYDYGDGTDYTLGAALSVSSYSTKNGGSGTTSLTTNTYDKFDGGQSTITFKPNVNQALTNTNVFAYRMIRGQ